MGFLQCKPPYWTGDDLSECIRQDYLQILLPLLIAAISASVLFEKTIRNWIYGENEYRLLKDTLADQLEHDEHFEDEDDVFAEHLSLRHTVSHQEFELREDKPRDEIFRVASEEVMLMALVGIELAFLFTNEGGRDKVTHIAGLITWVYALVLATLRLLLPTSTVIPLPKLWGHSAAIYLIMFSLGLFPFRSDIIHPPARPVYILDIVEFVLVTLLVTVMITSRHGNKSVWQEKVGDLEPSKEPLASLFSLATFGWINPLIWKGYMSPLQLSDVWNLRDDDLALNVISSFRQTKKAVSLAMTLAKHFKKLLVIQALWAVSYSLLTFAPTLLVRVILEYVQSPESTPRSAAWLFVALLFITSFISSIGNAQALYVGRRICIRLRAIIVGEVYAKALRRKAVAGSEKAVEDGKKDGKKEGKKDSKPDVKDDKKEDDLQANVGTIINLMAVDSQKVSEVCAYLHYLIAGVPVQILLAVILLYQILGWSSIVGISTMVLLLPINYLISRQFSIVQRKIMETTDKRILATNEVLTNIRIIKYFAWEERFAEIVGQSRRAELKQLRNRYMLWAVAATVWYTSPLIITMLSFFSYTVIEKKELGAPIAFTALSLFNVLRVPLDQLADMITNILQTKVSIDRVQEFLNEEETEKYAQLKDDGSDHMLIGFEDGEYTWGTKNAMQKNPGSTFTLRNLNIEFVPGKLNIIAGPTGSGKTSLLMALLGEMTCIKGKVFLPGSHSREDLIPDSNGLTDSVAYCAQQAWLVNATIKENIIFASPFDKKRYKAVLHACALERDLQILDNGDETEVGEKGITLSGGQKQRISLARALYSSSKHLLLDDCFSAVDSHTSKYLYEHCIMGPLMANRTCILVTHNLALCLPYAKFVVALNNGDVMATGSPDDVIASGALGKSELLKKSSPSTSQATTRVPSSAALDELVRIETQRNDEPMPEEAAIDANETIKSKPSNEETKTEGSVDWHVYYLYLKAMGPWWFWLFVILVFVGQQFMTVASSIWIREWAKQYEEESLPTAVKSYFNRPARHYVASNSYSGAGSGPGVLFFPSDKDAMGTFVKKEVDVKYYLLIYGAIGLTYALLSLIREAVVFGGSLRASRIIHQRLLESVLRAKFRFFDSTPIGRIMNRFSKDLEAIDQEVAPTALGMIHCLGSVIVIVILISAITPGFLLAGVVITGLYFLIGAFYVRASRDLKRIESIQKSPLYQHFGETLSGIATIRAYGDERRFIRENLNLIDKHNRPFFYLWVCNRWLGFRVDFAGALVSFFAGVFVVLSVGKIDAGLAGLSLTYAITFTDNVLWVVRLYAVNEQNMNSVERIREYLQIDKEAAAVVEGNRPAKDWPSEGSLTFDKYSARYRPDLDLVLKNVTFSLKPHEKLGIVGRTGAGKSSLALALFRSLEAETGRIIVDGVNIGEIGLKDLRRNITMVPQDPTLFTGTIRSNLDPFHLYSDADIFEVLERVELIPRLRDPSAVEVGNKNVFLNLSNPIAESGNNLSQGQKQLLCLARALLREPKIVVFDEATASIDYETDSKIQHAIRQLESTTITIAHRLASIIYYDKVLVLDHGEVKEFAHPWELVQQEGSIFREMCIASGELPLLEKAAKDAFEVAEGTPASGR